MRTAKALVTCFVVSSVVAAPHLSAQTPPGGPTYLVPNARAAGAWPRVNIPDPMADSLLRLGLDEAARLLADERCQTILTDFRTGQGQPLADTLRGFGLSILDFLPLVHFRDGSSSPSCRNAVAYTSTGSRVVFVCTRAMERHWRENRNHVVFAIIHEVLHTLGLGENPPSSVDITNLIHTRCWAALRANARQ